LPGALACSSRRTKSKFTSRVEAQNPGLPRAKQQFQEIMMVQCAAKNMFVIPHISQLMNLLMNLLITLLLDLTSDQAWHADMTRHAIWFISTIA